MLAAAGVCSRRRAETLIIEGRVAVNGQTISLLGTQVDPEHDTVTVDGVPVRLAAKRTLMLHKPAGFITTRSDPNARDTVMHLVPDVPGLHPIGRLDKDTTGLLLFTNDGALTYALTHPKHVVEKTYRAWVEGTPNDAALARLRSGVELDDGLTAPATVRCAQTRAGKTEVELIIHEGRKRQVRRMLFAVGFPVLALARVRVGPLSLDDLPEGRWRDLTDAEVDALYRAAGVPR